MSLTRSLAVWRFAFILALCLPLALPAVPPPVFPPDNSSNITTSNGWLFVEEAPDVTAPVLFSTPNIDFVFDAINPHLLIVNSQTGQNISSLSLFLNGAAEDRICKLRGLAAHPATGKLYAMMELGFFDVEFDETYCGEGFTSYLVEIDPITGSTDIIGDTYDAFAALAFDNGGVLYGVLGDISISGELYSIDITTASTSFITALSAVSGHALAFNPNDGLLYHATTQVASSIFETYDLNTSILTPITVPAASSLNADDPGAMTWDAVGNQFLYTPLTISTLYQLGTDGSTSFSGNMQHESVGLAFATPNANTFNLYYTCVPAIGGGYDYTFSLRPEKPAALSALIGQVAFFEEAVGLPSITGHSFPNGLPAFFDVELDGVIQGVHVGKGFTSVSNGLWQPSSLNSQLNWTSHADNVSPIVLWSAWELSSNPPTFEFIEAIKIQSYDFYFGTTNPPTELICPQNTQTFCALPQGQATLLPCTTYYWQLKNVNDVNDVGPVWSFTTTFNFLFDFSGNGMVNFLDYATFATHYGRTDCNAGNNWCDNADTNQDGAVGLLEMQQFANEFLFACPL